MTIERTSINFEETKTVYVAIGDKQEYLFIDDRSENKRLQRIFEIAEGAQLKLITLILDNQETVMEVITNLQGHDAKVEHYILIINSGEQKSELKVRSEHLVGHSQSRLIVRKILDQAASSSFDGLIKIHKQAQDSDGSLNEATLVLSNDVFNRSVPALEIGANQVRASHSSAQSKLAADDLLYLQGRGLDESEAKQILVDAFAAKVYEVIGDLAIQEQIKQVLTAKINHEF